MKSPERFSSETIPSMRYVQRINPVIKPGFKNPFSFGGGGSGLDNKFYAAISQFAEFDYMGAAEYEFGALARAFERLVKRDQAGDSMSVVSFKIKSKPVYALINKSQESDVKAAVKYLLGKRADWSLKCPSMFKTIFEEGNTEYARTRGWIELDSGFMFFLDKSMADQFHDLLKQVKV